ncbi:restriction endonuclease subunit S [bacterium]|nr:restriction endonuclease subunit S [bacterium]
MKYALLEDICSIQIGKTPSRAVPDFWGGELPWVTISDMSGERYISTTKEGITEHGANKSGSKLIPSGTLLLSFKLSLGKRAITAFDLYTNEAIAALIDLDKTRIDQTFLYWALGVIDYGVLVDRAAKGKTLNKAKLRKIRIPLPPLAEQKRIAGILDAADALRAKRRESIEQLDALLQSTFLEMFGDPVTNPKGWEYLTGDVVFSELKYGTSRKSIDVPVVDSMPVLRIPNILGGQIDWSDLKYTVPNTNELKNLLLVKDDLLFVRTNGNPDYIGRCARYDGSRPSLFASYLIRGRIRAPESVLSEFLKHQIEFPTYRHEVRREARTTAGNYNLSTAGIRKFTFVVPPVKMQQKFVDTVVVCQKQKNSLASHLDELDTLFDSLQQRAFNGEL